jgi:hypothetical protein
MHACNGYVVFDSVRTKVKIRMKFIAKLESSRGGIHIILRQDALAYFGGPAMGTSGWGGAVNELSHCRFRRSKYFC